MCKEKEVGNSHTLIVKNFPNRIKEIICLNWDNLIERGSQEPRERYNED